ncbi:MAG: family 10 glycosylhydrolase [Candidatus Merdivicinus sp.]|jgi:uncharacterized lipoprotein YddW (UPF0748 family)
MKHLKHICAWFLSLAIVLTVLPLPVSAAGSTPKEFRAVWVSTINHLDYPNQTTTDPAQLKQQADLILDNCVAMGMNAVILQVRPSGDAIYPSEIYPWSQHLTGAQGLAPQNGFDPLEYWVTEAHKRGLELHAWINPYRVTRSKDADYNSLAANNPALLHPDWVVKHTDGNYYLDPGLPEVRQLVVDGAAEIVRNYDVDGIHMDDYFYPGTNFDDADTFAKYGAGFSSIGDWRRNNVDLLVQELDSTLHKLDPDISFGISPFGIWANASGMSGGSNTNGNQTYFSHYADTRKWVKEGWLDYICPQIYWEIGHNLADYQTLAYWWADVVKGTDVELYIGMADYKAGNSSSSSPWYGIKAIQDQVALNAKIPEITGEVHFRYKFLLSVPGLEQFYKDTYVTGATPVEPSEPETPVEPEQPEVPSDGVTSRYFSKDQSGEWVRYTNGTWNFLISGKPATGWRMIDGTYYFFDNQGTMKTGWLLHNGSWYYLKSSGAMATGWILDNGSWYYLKNWGGMSVGWQKVGNTWYWMNSSGAMKANGWQLIGNQWYYFYADGAMAANTTTPDGYYVGASGAMV